MSTTAVSHAEPTLFLTDSEEFQVRAHTTKKGDLFFSTVDFIRNVLEEDVSKDEAIILWMIITQIHKDREVNLNIFQIFLIFLTFCAVSHLQQQDGAVCRTVWARDTVPQGRGPLVHVSLYGPDSEDEA